MHPLRRKRLIVIVFILAGVAVTATLVLSALEENINLFYPPEQVAGGEAPVAKRIRVGGMVLEGSVERASDSLEVGFVLTDRRGSEVGVRYTGLLPDLFREGQGILVTGELDQAGVFQADEVLAKHDENYMPPELLQADIQ
jgi:cytochrome c-type biogenesis protein CcmE